MALLQLEQVGKRFGATVALHPTDLAIDRGEFVTLLGPSGCGKSTLLRIVCGVTPASGGQITLDGRRIEALPPEARDIAMVFQTYALFPHMNVRKNLEFGLRMKKVAPAEQRRRIDHALQICNLNGLLDRMPRQLSGGQQQRVALARAIVMQPALMLFDEPLSNLDAKLRESLRAELVRLHKATGSTSLYVTHDQAEAMSMSDRVLVMNAGQVLESGTPVELYRRPRHAFTAGFLGQTNLLALTVRDGVAELPWGQRLTVDDAPAGAAAVRCSLRPEDLSFVPDPQGPATVTELSFGGSAVHYRLHLGELELMAQRSGSAELLPPGTRVALQAQVALRALRPEREDRP